MMASLVRRWMGPETNPVDVAAGIRWLKDHITLPGQGVVAIIQASTNHPVLIAHFLEAKLLIYGSKTDFLVMSAKVGKSLRCTRTCMFLVQCLTHMMGVAQGYLPCVH